RTTRSPPYTTHSTSSVRRGQDRWAGGACLVVASGLVGVIGEQPHLAEVASRGAMGAAERAELRPKTLKLGPVVCPRELEGQVSSTTISEWPVGSRNQNI